ncbi:MAG: 4'-phosphopantetheinyl transferase superfamily protein [bacterium]|nr:4'-phosphopantetheinyl transferase superfamily protein [bacterium]
MKYAVISVADAAARFSKHISEETLHYFAEQKPFSSPESLAGRLLVAQLAELSPEQTNRFLRGSIGNFESKEYGFFWSISHKEEKIAAAIAEKPIGIDIEKIRPRAESLFSIFTETEWNLLGQKEWPYFYRGWTAKEAALKVLSLDLEQLPKIRIVENRKDSLILEYESRRVLAHVFAENDLVISVAESANE